jgi:DNA polymerase-3 subunit gamma/tau
LLDRGLQSYTKNEELNLKKAQKIYGYFDKSSLIELFQNLFKGDENNVINSYRRIYELGVEPKTFLNDFLEILYFIKNISSIKLDGTNFSLNDDEFMEIDRISKIVEPKDILLFWQFTIEAIDELNIVANPNLCVEMFLIRLMYVKGYNKQDYIDITNAENKLDNTNR